MIDVTPDYLLNIVDSETLKKIWRAMRGSRVYFPKCKSEHDEIRELYKSVSEGISHAEAVRRLSEIFNKSERQIREVLRSQKGLFDEEY